MRRTLIKENKGISGSYGSLNRSDEPIVEEISERYGWYDISKDGGGDVDLSDYPLFNENGR